MSKKKTGDNSYLSQSSIKFILDGSVSSDHISKYIIYLKNNFSIKNKLPLPFNFIPFSDAYFLK